MTMIVAGIDGLSAYIRLQSSQHINIFDKTGTGYTCRFTEVDQLSHELKEEFCQILRLCAECASIGSQPTATAPRRPTSTHCP